MYVLYKYVKTLHIRSNPLLYVLATYIELETLRVES